MTEQKTLALIKPNVVPEDVKEIEQLIELHGFTVIVQQKFQVCACMRARV